MFRDRTDAGEQLADALAGQNHRIDLVLAVPRGGVEPGQIVADRLDASLDVVVAKKLGAPHNPEFAIGAAAEDGSVWMNPEFADDRDVSEEYIDRERATRSEEARKKAERYRDHPLGDLTGKRIVVVDDGIATGATMRACLQRIRDDDPAHLVVAVPVGPSETLDDLRTLVDAVTVVETPDAFRSVGAHYRTFEQVTDEEARTFLH